MRLLGVDFGFKRIGIAVAETDPEIISARPTIEASGTLKSDAQRLIEMARKEEAEALVLGLPLEEDGIEGRMARICRTLAGHISDGGVVVHLVDESMTSLEAEVRLRAAPTRQESSGKRGDDMKASQIRKLKDGEAARLILERFIATMSAGR